MFNNIMSNSNTFNNSNFQQTPIIDAYQFSSFSQYINNGCLKPNFSPVCIFCSSNNSTSLMNDGGSFRQCNRCKKHFKARIN
jgi:hypothetical protein